MRHILLASLCVTALLIGPSVISAAVIGPTENGDLSAGDSSNWTIEGSSWAYLDVGGAHGGVLQSGQSGETYDETLHNNTLADVGYSGSIDFMINTFPSGAGGEFGFGFLGSATHGNQTIASRDNNENARGYYVNIKYAWGSLTVALYRRTGSWNTTSLDTASGLTFGGDFNDGLWHTLAVDLDGVGGISVKLDDSEILSATEGANYLPTAYSSSYTGGGLWGAYTGTSSVNVYVDNLTVGPVPEPATLAMLAIGGLGLAASARRRRRR